MKEKVIVKERTQRELIKERTHVYTPNTDKDYDLLQDRPILLSERAPHDKQTHNFLDYSQDLFKSPRGAQCQDGLNG
jgi:hypothetical protein